MVSISLILVFGSPYPVTGKSIPWWQQSINVESKVGTDRSIQSLDLMYPLTHSTSSLTFTDLRGRVDDDQSVEVNLGLAQRSVINDPIGLGDEAVFGLYGFADRLESEFDNVFYQGTLGAEYFTKDYSFRVNGYLPEDDRKPTTTFTQLRATGTQIYFENRQNFERPLPGYDIEVGKTVRFDGWQLYGRGSYFRFHHSDVAEVEGSRFRTGVQFDGSHPDVYLPEGSQLTLGLEWQEDQVRDEQTFGVFRVSMPFGSVESRESGVQSQTINQNRKTNIKHNDSRRQTQDSGLSAWQKDRLTERIERDVDIVTGQAEEASKSVPAVNAATGDTLNSVTLAKGGADGKGTLQDPGDLKTAVKLAGTRGTVFVDDSGGTLTSSGLTIASGQSLLGGQSRLIVETPDGSIRRVFSLGTGGRPVIKGTSSKPTLQFDTGTNNHTVKDLTITGKGDALRGTDNRNLTLDNVIVRDVSGDGLDLRNPNGDLVMRSSSVTALGRAIDVEGGRPDLSITDSSLNSKGESVLRVTGTTGGSIIVDSASSFQATNVSIGAELRNNHSTIDLRNLTASGVDTGIWVRGGSGTSRFRDVDVVADTYALRSKNVSGTVAVNGGTLETDGGRAAVSVNGGSTAIFSDVTVVGTGARGIDLVDPATRVRVDSVSVSADRTGLRRYGGAADMLVQDLDVSSTNQDGITASNPTGGSVEVRNSHVRSAGGRGLFFDGVSGGTITDLRLENSTNEGMFVKDSNSIKADSVTVASPGDDALRVQNSSSLDLQELDLSTSSGHGLNLANADNVSLRKMDVSVDGGGNRGLNIQSPGGTWTVRDANVDVNNAEGVVLRGGTADVTFNNITVSKNFSTTRGFFINNTGGGSVSIRNSTIKESDATGIFIEQSDNVVVDNVNLRSSEIGIAIKESASITGNSISMDDMGTVGIYTYSSASGINFQDVHVDNSDFGLVVQSGASMDLRDFDFSNVTQGVGITDVNDGGDVHLDGRVTGASLAFNIESSTNVNSVTGDIQHDLSASPCSIGTSTASFSSLTLRNNPDVWLYKPSTDSCEKNP